MSSTVHPLVIIPAEELFAEELSAVQADDRLLDALAAAVPHPRAELAEDELVEDELNALLLDWRNDVDTEVCRELVDTKTALAILAAA